MRAYEFPLEVSLDGRLVIPARVMNGLPPRPVGRVLLLIVEPEDSDEQSIWSTLTRDHFLAGYGEADALYVAL